jgi:hypothetical protein
VRGNLVSARAKWGRVRYLAAGEKPGHGTAGRGITPVLVGPALGMAGLLGIAGLAGCSAVASAGATGTACGMTRTAAGEAVTIDVAKGPVNCATVLRVEAGYAAAIRNGDLRGNGGGAPIAVGGWTCESYPAMEALRTRDASECHMANAEVVAVLSVSSTASAAASTGN